MQFLYHLLGLFADILWPGRLLRSLSFYVSRNDHPYRNDVYTTKFGAALNMNTSVLDVVFAIQ